jgi:hypothetical protein
MADHQYEVLKRRKEDVQLSEKASRMNALARLKNSRAARSSSSPSPPEAVDTATAHTSPSLPDIEKHDKAVSKEQRLKDTEIYLRENKALPEMVEFMMDGLSFGRRGTSQEGEENE